MNDNFMNEQSTDELKKITDVAVAVIFFEDNYLLGYRHAEQHQGEKFEFVGGKIEKGETEMQGLIREVEEEIGLIITPEQCTKMGDIDFDYPEKTVSLRVYAVEMYARQYQDFSTIHTGKLNQPLKWAIKQDLLDKIYPLPEANSKILDWIRSR